MTIDNPEPHTTPAIPAITYDKAFVFRLVLTPPGPERLAAGDPVRATVSYCGWDGGVNLDGKTVDREGTFSLNGAAVAYKNKAGNDATIDPTDLFNAVLAAAGGVIIAGKAN